MKLLINSDGSMALDGDAAGLAEFALAMRRSTSNKLMPGVAEPAFDEPQPPVNIPAADKSNKRAIGSNHEFALRICNDGWISRVDIIAAAEKAGLNGKSLDVVLPMLLNRGLLERRKLSPGGVEYRATPSTLSAS